MGRTLSRTPTPTATPSQTPRGERIAAADRRFHRLLGAALGGAEPVRDGRANGVAVVGIGGYGRGELALGSDLDVVLVHEDRVDIEEIAAGLWYPLWDDGVRLDHTVRTVDEALAATHADLRSAMSLLDARHVTGDRALTLRLRSNVRAAWRQAARRRLPELEASCSERAGRVGELAQLLEPDLKEGAGGLRDVTALRAIAASWLVEVPLAEVDAAAAVLLDVRDALHEVFAARRGDRLVAEAQADVAARLGLAGRDDLLRLVHGAGRRVALLADHAWRRVGQALADRSVRSARRVRRSGRLAYGPRLEQVASGVALSGGEVVLEPDATPRGEPGIALRVAAAAAERGVVPSPVTVARLARELGAVPEPWTEEMRGWFTRLLGSGRGLLPVWERLDQAGLVEAFLPEWDAVRGLPQRSPVHRHTVDRHLLETCVYAGGLTERVRRPDLVLLAGLLHDIEKRRGTEHAEAGAATASRVVTRMGYAEDDAAFVARLVSHHLVLARTAVGRDLDDPETIEQVASLVGDVELLDALAVLTEADARATGPAAWSSWRAGLVGRLVDRVCAALASGERRLAYGG